MEQQTYHGSCHCGAVTYDVVMQMPETAMECNCSHCERKGFLLAFVPREQLTVLSGEDNLTEYRFNKKHIAHLFCKTCGVQCFGYGEGTDGTKMASINLRTLHDIDIDAIPRNKVNGKDY
jgi:hypothetical protein